MQLSKALSEAISRLVVRHPFWAVLIMQLLEIKESDAVPTAGTNGKELIVNPTWFGTLKLDERVFLLAHEVLHVVFQHMNRGQLYEQRGFGPDMQPWSHSLYNEAADYVINDTIIQSGLDAMPKGGMWDRRIGTYEDLADDVYVRLNAKRQQEQQQGQQGQQPGDPGSGVTGQGDPTGQGNWDTHMSPKADAAPPSDAEIKRILKSAEAAQRSKGNLPGALQRLVDSVCEPQVDWREQLRLNISTTAGRDEASWVRPNRKRMAIPPHVYLPGMTGHRAGTVVVYGDTSRSVQDNEWSAYFAEMGAIVDELTPEHCYIGSCDTRATDPLEIDSADDVADYKPVGGGGTHLPAIFAKLAEHDIRPDVLVILTDGYTDFGVEPPYPVIWGITSDVVAPYGQTIHIKVTI